MLGVRSHGAVVLIALIIVSLISPGDTQAQGQENSAGQAQTRPVRLDEIIVTSQKREEDLQRVPVAVTAFDQQAIEAFNLTSTEEFGNFVPGVWTAEVTGDSSTMTGGIRGIAGGFDILYTAEPRLGIYVDGVYLGHAVGAILDLVDIERIEVLRGPQGTLYGKNVTAGAINFISAKPSGEFGFKQKAGFGSRGYWRTLTALDLPAVNGLSAKLSYSRVNHDGIVRNGSTASPARMLGTIDNQAYRIALRWSPAETLTVDYSFDRSDNNGVSKGSQVVWLDPGSFGDRFGVPVSSRRLSTLFLDGQDKTHVEVDGHNLTAAWEVGGISLKSITAYRTTRKDEKGKDLDGGTITPTLNHSTADDVARQFSQEIQAQGQLGSDRLRYLVGAYYFRENADNFNQSTIFFLQPPTVLDLETESQAVFGQLTYVPDVFNQSLDVTAGLRYTKDDKNIGAFVGSIQSAGFSPTNLARGAESWSNLDWMVNVGWQAADDVYAYGRLSTGYNAGGFDGRARGFVDGVPAVTIPFDEEKLTAYEIGLKSEWWQNRLRLNLAGYYYELKDQQIAQTVSFSGGGLNIITDNAGLSEAKGFEIELLAAPVAGLTIGGGYGYVDIDFKKYEQRDPATGIVSDVSALVTPRWMPKHTGNFFIQYEFPPFRLGELSVRVNGSHTGTRTHDQFFPRAAQVDGYTLYDASIRLRQIPAGRGHLELVAWGKNLTDEEYLLSNAYFGTSLGYANGPFGELRSYGVNVTFEY